MSFFPDSELLLFSSCLLLAYAEIHYKFRWIPSRYFKKEPEIISDVPTRIEPGAALPILLITKDAHLFPVKLLALQINIAKNTATPITHQIEINEAVNTRFWERIFEIEREILPAGECKISCEIHYEIRGKKQICMQDNYKLSSHAPFRVTISEHKLPLLTGFATGDLHTHSSNTNDQLEFAASPTATARMAKALGHHFCAITDHSYDLDDQPDNYLKNDPDLKKWHAFQAECRALNTRSKNFQIIPGEEVSCGNKAGKNVHFLLFNNPDFIPGAGDSGERWLRFKPDLSIPEVIEKLSDAALCFAAHPEVEIPRSQRLLLNRGSWQFADYQHKKLTGLQIWNGDLNGIECAKANWITLLLQGRKKFIIAGTDAHGNFNRFRQITMPHLSMVDQSDFQLFGQHRTLLALDGELSLPTIMQALRTGAAAITSGPFLAIYARDEQNRTFKMGQSISSKNLTLHLTALSSPEFRNIETIRVFCGEIGRESETLIFEQSFPKSCYQFKKQLRLSVTDSAQKYYRAELIATPFNALPNRALTNPIWHGTI